MADKHAAAALGEKATFAVEVLDAPAALRELATQPLP